LSVGLLYHDTELLEYQDMYQYHAQGSHQRSGQGMEQQIGIQGPADEGVGFLKE
jgi:hypothetical protein